MCVVFGEGQLFLLLLFVFLAPHPLHMEVPRLGVESELELPATAMATGDLSGICNLLRSLRQRGILNPLSEARDQTRNLRDTSQVRYILKGSPWLLHWEC